MTSDYIYVNDRQISTKDPIPYNPSIHPLKSKHYTGPRINSFETLRLKIEWIHGVGRYEILDQPYVSSKTKIKLRCDLHGEFQKHPSHLMHKGMGCPVCGSIRGGAKNTITTEDFVKNAVRVHGDKFSYHETHYKHHSSPVRIYCNHCKESFNQTPNAHIQSKYGCPLCVSRNSTSRQLMNLKLWVDECERIHKSKYSYDKVDYAGASKKVCITCPLHGDFYQLAGSHKRGHGCPSCATMCMFTGNERRFINAILYIVKMSSKYEEFLKVGVTTNNVHRRIKAINKQCSVKYDYEVIMLKESSLDVIIDAEQTVHLDKRLVSLSPIETFSGQRECYDLSEETVILEIIGSFFEVKVNPPSL